MASEAVKEKIERFKELIKGGYSVRKALRESGLSSQQYTKRYEEIWSDPEMEPYRPQKRSREQSSQPQAQASEGPQASGAQGQAQSKPGEGSPKEPDKPEGPEQGARRARAARP